MREPAPSLERKLVTRLVALSLLASCVGFVGLVIKSYRIASGLSDEGQADLFVGEFLKEAAWTFPLFVSVLIAVVVMTVRSSLKPLKEASDRAAAISPARTDLRLDVEAVPREVAPLVSAMNLALERLEAGFAAQRRFTGDAAHELRTPLAILTAGLETLPDSPEVERLRADAARMGRLVEQLLRVARLDSLPLDMSARLDLSELAADVVAQLAPWAAALDRALAYEPPASPVRVMGNADALAAAARNLIENAVRHAPPGTEVVIRVEPSGALSVADRGPGVPVDQRPHVFERFWRAPGEGRSGTGLGLAIVDEVARAHRGAVQIVETAGGGATFVLQLPRVGP